ncbi:MAG: hypothetical protein ACI9MF_002755 [Gammaproteobacteria bacterium]|jgi:hypothetical protein
MLSSGKSGYYKDPAFASRTPRAIELNFNLDNQMDWIELLIKKNEGIAKDSINLVCVCSEDDGFELVYIASQGTWDENNLASGSVYRLKKSLAPDI